MAPPHDFRKVYPTKMARWPNVCIYLWTGLVQKQPAPQGMTGCEAAVDPRWAAQEIAHSAGPPLCYVDLKVEIWRQESKLWTPTYLH